MTKEEMKLQKDAYEEMMMPYYKKATEFLEGQEKSACDQIKAIIKKAIKDAMPEINHVIEMYKVVGLHASTTDDYGHYVDMGDNVDFIYNIDFSCGIKYDHESLAVAFMNAENEESEDYAQEIGARPY